MSRIEADIVILRKLTVRILALFGKGAVYPNVKQSENGFLVAGNNC